MSDVFDELASDIKNELAEAESAQRSAEADVATATDARDVARLVRSELAAALGKLDPDGPTAARLRARIHAQRLVEEGVLVYPAGMLANAKLRVANLHAELQEIQRATAFAPVVTAVEEVGDDGQW